MAKNPYADMLCRALEERGQARAAFSGRSMLPTLKEGMTVAVQKTAPGDIKPADIILYRKGGQTVVHRVIRILRDGRTAAFFTKGDNQIFISGDCVPEDNVIGRVTGAFSEDEPQKNRLVNNKFTSWSYVALGNLSDLAMRSSKNAPHFARHLLKHIVSAFFLTFKRSIHITYIGMRRGKLFFGRCRKGAPTV